MKKVNDIKKIPNVPTQALLWSYAAVYQRILDTNSVWIGTGKFIRNQNGSLIECVAKWYGPEAIKSFLSRFNPEDASTIKRYANLVRA